jgi:phage nucleotide-binding protein
VAAVNSIRDDLEVTSPDQIEYLNLLVFGEPGAGKTYLAGTAQDHPKTSPVLVVDVEGGTTTLRHRDDIDVVQARSMQHVVEIHNKLKIDNNGYYQTVVIDSLTELQKLDMAGIMKELVERRPDRDVDVPDVREWGKTGTHMRQIVRAYRDLPMNTILTALVDPFKDSSGTVVLYPNLPGKMRTELAGFFDVVGYLYTRPDEEKEVIDRIIQFTGTQHVIAKDRTAELGNFLVNPTIPEMFDLIHNTNGKGKGK